MALPDIVDRRSWTRAHASLLQEEKELTRRATELAARRRRQPMLELDTGHEFDGPAGRVRLPDLFEGRSQLLLYHFWFPEDGEPCTGCSMFTDQVSELAHLHARDTSLALVSRAPQDRIAPYRDRMGWQVPWYTVVGDAFQQDRGTTEYFSLDVMLRDGDRVFLTHEVRSRGVESLGSVWTFLDLTAFGRQEEWEDTPSGRPQTPKFAWWRRHDEYEAG
jgi:predicted dithiol-disulfide oxidoreductase (DUF899 family)